MEESVLQFYSEEEYEMLDVSKLAPNIIPCVMISEFIAYSPLFDDYFEV